MFRITGGLKSGLRVRAPAHGAFEIRLAWSERRNLLRVVAAAPPEFPPARATSSPTGVQRTRSNRRLGPRTLPGALREAGGPVGPQSG